MNKFKKFLVGGVLTSVLLCSYFLGEMQSAGSEVFADIDATEIANGESIEIEKTGLYTLELNSQKGKKAYIKKTVSSLPDEPLTESYFDEGTEGKKCILNLKLSKGDIVKISAYKAEYYTGKKAESSCAIKKDELTEEQYNKALSLVDKEFYEKYNIPYPPTAFGGLLTYENGEAGDSSCLYINNKLALFLVGGTGGVTGEIPASYASLPGVWVGTPSGVRNSSGTLTTIYDLLNKDARGFGIDSAFLDIIEVIEVEPSSCEEVKGLIYPCKEDNSSFPDLSEVISRLDNISLKLDGLENSVPTITVCEDQNFDVAVGYYDDMVSGSSADGRVTVTNSAVGDKAIKVSGKLTTKGVYIVDINGKTFIFKVIEEPTASNVKVILE